jgi:hypothetical protein
MTQIEQIEITRALHAIVEEKLQKQSQGPAQDPAAAGGIGQPVPAEVVQGGAEQMTPPPGAAVGAPPPPQDPATQLVELVSQLGMLVEQGLTMMAELLTRTADSQERVERQLILLTGQQLEQAKSAPPAPAPAPAKVATVTPPDGFYDVASAGRDGTSARPTDADSLKNQLRKSASLAAAVALIQSRRDSL